MNAEGINKNRYMIYDNGNYYLNLNIFTKFENIKNVSVKDNKLIITSTIPYIYVDLLCTEYHESDVLGVVQEFVHLGSGKFETKIIKNLTLLNLIEEAGYENCSLLNE